MSASFSVPSIIAIVSAMADAPSGLVRPSATTAATRTALSWSLRSGARLTAAVFPSLPVWASASATATRVAGSGSFSAAVSGTTPSLATGGNWVMTTAISRRTRDSFTSHS